MKQLFGQVPRQGLVGVLALAAGAAACAQDDGAPPTVLHLAQAGASTTLHVAQGAPATTRVVTVDEDTLAFAASELGQERVLKGAPYCADAVHESVQWLPDADGGPPNRIVRKQASRLCRDGEGRTRQEVERGGRSLVYLHDPVAREAWVLDPQRKTARRLATVKLPVKPGQNAAEPQAVDHSAWRDYSERMRVWAQDFARSLRGVQPPPVPPVPAPPAVPGGGAVPAVPAVPPVPAVPGAAPAAPAAPAAAAAPVLIQRSEVHVADGSASGARREVRVQVIRPGDAGSVAAPPLPPQPPAPPPAVVMRAQVLAPRGPAVATLLPARDIDGVRAQGERSTWTIEAGRVGNERPIQIVREVWTSSELGLTLSSRDFDPRSGEQLYRLQNLRRGEPEAALMRVPADYSVTGRTVTRPPAPPASARG